MDRRLTLILAVFPVMMTISLTSLQAVSEESKRFNNLGMGLYEKAEYIAAAESFIRSLETDPTNFLAHYNLACTLTLLRGEYVPKDFEDEKLASFDIYLESILDHLKTAADINEHRKTRMLEDPDLYSLQSLLRFHQIAGRSLLRKEEAEIILPPVRWRLDYNHDFGKKNHFPEGTISFTTGGSFTAALWDEQARYKGTYYLHEGRVMLRYRSADGGMKSALGIFSKDGAIISGLGDEPVIMWNDVSE